MSGRKYVKGAESEFRDNFNYHPFTFQHDLAKEPEVQLEALLQLAERLPRAQVLHWSGKIPIDASVDTASKTHPNGLSLHDTFDRLDEVGSYVLIRNAQLDPSFNRFLEPVFAEVEAMVSPIEGGMCDRIAYAFIASPGSVTPYHMDRDINFHFNVRGTKWISIWDPFDRDMLPETGLERLFTDWNAPRPPFLREFEQRARVFELHAGDGVHHPFTAPHAIRYGNEVAASFTVTFNTHATRRRAVAHSPNHVLRKAGLAPAPVGTSELHDELKFRTLDAYRRAKSVVRACGRYLRP